MDQPYMLFISGLLTFLSMRTRIRHSLRLCTRCTDWNSWFPSLFWVLFADWNSTFPSPEYQVYGLEFSIPFVILGFNCGLEFYIPYARIPGVRAGIFGSLRYPGFWFADWKSTFPALFRCTD